MCGQRHLVNVDCGDKYTLSLALCDSKICTSRRRNVDWRRRDVCRMVDENKVHHRYKNLSLSPYNNNVQYDTIKDCLILPWKMAI